MPSVFPAKAISNWLQHNISAAVLAAFVSMVVNSNSRKTKRCLELFDTWMSDSYQDDKKIIFDTVNYFLNTGRKSLKPLSYICNDDQVYAGIIYRIYNAAQNDIDLKEMHGEFPGAFRRLTSFIITLSILCKKGYLDKRLFQELFSHELIIFCATLVNSEGIERDFRINNEAWFRYKLVVELRDFLDGKKSSAIISTSFQLRLCLFFSVIGLFIIYIFLELNLDFLLAHFTFLDIAF